MKPSGILIAACAATAFIFTACDKKDGGAYGGAPSEKEALADFKKASEELNAITNAPPDASNPMAGLTQIKTVFAKMEAIKTEGLPADLKEAFTAFRSKFSEMAAVLKGMPEKQEDLLAWGQKMMSDPELGAKMGKIGQEIEPLANKLTEVAKKHGIEVQMNK